jgi:hypothetical protein
MTPENEVEQVVRPAEWSFKEQSQVALDGILYGWEPYSSTPMRGGCSSRILCSMHRFLSVQSFSPSITPARPTPF